MYLLLVICYKPVLSPEQGGEQCGSCDEVHTVGVFSSGMTSLFWADSVCTEMK